MLIEDFLAPGLNRGPLTLPSPPAYRQAGAEERGG
jgi:hypothetical protein